MIVERLSQEELEDIAVRVYHGDVCLGHDWRTLEAFIVLMLTSEPLPEEVGFVWEEMAKASPVALNGHPTFFSCRLGHRDDWPLLVEAIGAVHARVGARDGG